MKKKLIFALVFLLLVAIVYVGARYQATVYLMPTPAVISTGDLNPFDINPDQKNSNEIQILFATNRIPAGVSDNRTYTIFPGDKLRMGIVRLQIGEIGTSWESILNLSTTKNSEQRPPLKLKNMQELAQHPLRKNNNAQPENIKAHSMQALTDMVNQALAGSIDKDITIYVHGANTGIYRASAQAAQYHHFTGQNSVFMVFLWPSAENLLAYGTDTQHALKSAPAFAELLSLLAQHTQAKNINILAYSAGAQIISPALDIIGRNTAEGKRKDFRLGEIYYAASDIGVDTFVKHLQNYIDMPRSTTIAVNRNDRVLALAAWRNKVSRLGRPDIDGLSEEKTQWLKGISNMPGLTIIKVSSETVSGMRTASHDFWYAHPWLSSDILSLFLFHKRPAERGLVEEVNDNNIRYWTFPPDYPARIIDIIKQAVETNRSQIFPESHEKRLISP